MFIASTIASVIFAVLLVGSGVSKLRKAPAQLQLMETVGLQENRLYPLGALELLAAAGLLVGTLWWPLAVAAAVGAILYFVGAIGSHVRVGDRNVKAAALMLIIAVAVLVMLLLSS